MEKSVLWKLLQKEVMDIKKAMIEAKCKCIVITDDVIVMVPVDQARNPSNS